MAYVGATASIRDGAPCSSCCAFLAFGCCCSPWSPPSSTPPKVWRGAARGVSSPMWREGGGRRLGGHADGGAMAGAQRRQPGGDESLDLDQSRPLRVGPGDDHHPARADLGGVRHSRRFALLGGTKAQTRRSVHQLAGVWGVRFG